MASANLLDIYLEYIDCLNRQEWSSLERYVAENVTYNGKFIGFAGYLTARQKEFHDIPDLRFIVQILISNEATVACRLNFDISPSGDFLGLPVRGKLISFSENVFYEFVNDKISRVWSVVDKAAIEAQLDAVPGR